MTADLRQVFNIIGERKEFEFEIPLTELEQSCGYDFAGSVTVSGSFIIVLTLFIWIIP